MRTSTIHRVPSVAGQEQVSCPASVPAILTALLAGDAVVVTLPTGQTLSAIPDNCDPGLEPGAVLVYRGLGMDEDGTMRTLRWRAGVEEESFFWDADPGLAIWLITTARDGELPAVLADLLVAWPEEP